MNKFCDKEKYTVYDLEKLIALLRGEGGCPWDREQTHKSIRREMLEEAYEACEAIDEDDPVHLREELGDVLLQVIFHAGIEEDKGSFNLDDVADAECRKMIFRHPHVFGDMNLSTSGQVLDMWDEVKKKEKAQTTDADTLRAVARSLPASWRAEKLQKKAEKAGFDVNDEKNSLKTVITLAETALMAHNTDELQTIFGKILFETVNAARKTGIDAEIALTGISDAFIEEFEKAGKKAGSETKD